MAINSITKFFRRHSPNVLVLLAIVTLLLMGSIMVYTFPNSIPGARNLHEWLFGHQESNFRERFVEHWDESNIATDLSLPEDVRQYLIYRCGQDAETCGGWGGRLKGMILGYVMAYLMDRTFKIEVFTPDCEITDYLVPNRIDWRLPMPIHGGEIFKRPGRHAVVLQDRHDFQKYFKKSTLAKDFSRNVPYVYINSNSDYVYEFKKRQAKLKQLSWMKGLRNDQIFSELYRRLFRLSPRLETRLQQLFNTHVPTPHHKLVCAQIRMGKQSTLGVPDEPTLLERDALSSVWKFISQHSVSDLHKVFIMSDSRTVHQEASGQSFGSRLITTPGPILHIDKDDKNEKVCEALEKVIFDQAILMNCDILLVSNSSLGHLAAYVRDSDEGLHCVSRHGVIMKCRRDQFMQLYDRLD